MILSPQCTQFGWRLSITSDVEKPRYNIVSFQTNTDNNHDTNPAVFDHCDVQSMNVFLNSTMIMTLILHKTSLLELTKISLNLRVIIILLIP